MARIGEEYIMAWTNMRKDLAETGSQQLGNAVYQPTRLERYEQEKSMLQVRIAQLDEAIASLKSNPDVEKIINALDRV